MFKKKNVLLILTILVVSVFIIANDANQKQVADVTVASNGIFFSPRVNHASLLLKIQTPYGGVYEKNLPAGASTYFALSDLSEYQLSNGSYTYELKAIPDIRNNTRTLEESMVKKVGESSPKPLVQSGYFLVLDGSIVTPGISEGGLKVQDIVHADDVIIDGSLCVGNDCYSGLAFGFDTIVLMENNLRIFFDDTSTIQNYPRNDWRIICNDSTDGGGRYFAIEDATEVSNILVLEAGAPDNSLYVDSHGDVGINTSTPYYELHIVDGDSPCVRLDQDGSYGWTPQKWDLCGNESNFFIRDATHASKLPFRIEPEAPTDSIFIKSNGKVGMGTGSPAYALEVEGTGSTAVVAQNTSGATVKFTAGANAGQIGTESNHNLKFMVNSSTEVMVLETTGDVGIGVSNPSYKLHIVGGAYCDGGAWVPGSSREYKENIVNVTTEEALDTIEKLTPVRFNYKTNKDEDYMGFIAEDVPELVATKERKGVSTMDVVAVLTKVVQDQQKCIKQQQRTISDLQNRITKLEKNK